MSDGFSEKETKVEDKPTTTFDSFENLLATAKSSKRTASDTNRCEALRKAKVGYYSKNK